MKLFLIFSLFFIVGCSKNDTSSPATQDVPVSPITQPPNSLPSDPSSANPIVTLSKVFIYDESLGACINEYQEIGYNKFKGEYVQCANYENLDLTDMDLSLFKIEGSLIQGSILKNTTLSPDQYLLVSLNKNTITESDFTSFESSLNLLYQKNNTYKNTYQNVYQNKIFKSIDITPTDKSNKFRGPDLNKNYNEMVLAYYQKYGDAGFKYDDRKNDTDNHNIKVKTQDTIDSKIKDYMNVGYQKILDQEVKIDEFNQKIIETLKNSISIRENKDLYIIQLNQTSIASEKEFLLNQIKDTKVQFEENHKNLVDLLKMRLEMELTVQDLRSKNLDLDASIEGLTNLINEFPSKI